jgi:hypothetical protein
MLKDKVIEIFVPADDFCIEFKKHIDQFRLQSGQIKQRNREASLQALALFNQCSLNVIQQ